MATPVIAPSDTTVALVMIHGLLMGISLLLLLVRLPRSRLDPERPPRG
jgi:hypothetical protein